MQQELSKPKYRCHDLLHTYKAEDYAPRVAKNLKTGEIKLMYLLFKAERRLVFDIIFQHEDTIYPHNDDEDGYKFIASNGYEIWSHSQMDIQTKRIWLLGSAEVGRAGTMTFSSNRKRDLAFDQFIIALNEWAQQ